MELVKIYAPTDYFVNCPYCDKIHKTNIDGLKIRCICKKSFITEFDQHEFGKNASYNIINCKNIL